MSMPDDLQAEQPRKQGMSSTAKVLLVLGTIAGVGLLLCCGGLAFVGFKYKDIFQGIAESTSSDPAVIKRRTQEVVQIDIPSEFTPTMMMGGQFEGKGMIEFIYQNPANQGSMLLIMEQNLPSPPGQTPKQRRDAMLHGMKQGQQFGGMNIQEESTETRDFTINGEDVPFEFAKGTVNGVQSRKIVGVFPGKKGDILLMLILAEKDYDDEKIVNMIKSIRLPGEATPAAKDESDEQTDMKPANAEEADAEEMESETETKSAPATP
jgi:hypothetical protein